MALSPHRAKVHPSPMPRPSANESDIPCWNAKASARAKIMQLTTMSGMKMPSTSWRPGTNAAMIKSTVVTNVAMTTTKMGILIFSGVTFLRADIMIFEPTRTNVAARPIPIPLKTARLVAKVGHIPRSIRNVGFSLIIPLLNSDLKLILPEPPCPLQPQTGGEPHPPHLLLPWKRW